MSIESVDQLYSVVQHLPDFHFGRVTSISDSAGNNEIVIFSFLLGRRLWFLLSSVASFFLLVMFFFLVLSNMLSPSTSPKIVFYIIEESLNDGFATLTRWTLGGRILLCAEPKTKGGMEGSVISYFEIDICRFLPFLVRSFLQPFLNSTSLRKNETRQGLDSKILNFWSPTQSILKRWYLSFERGNWRV